MSGWIDASAEKPDANSIVLIATQHDPEPVWVGYYDDSCWRCIDGMPVDVTHWMELPEPPNTEATDAQ